MIIYLVVSKRVNYSSENQPFMHMRKTLSKLKAFHLNPFVNIVKDFIR